MRFCDLCISEETEKHKERLMNLEKIKNEMGMSVLLAHLQFRSTCPVCDTTLSYADMFLSSIPFKLSLGEKDTHTVYMRVCRKCQLEEIKRSDLLLLPLLYQGGIGR